MNRIFLAALLLIVSGCATTTYYEDCTHNDLYKRYGGIQECISELKGYDSRKANALQQISNGFKGQ